MWNHERMMNLAENLAMVMAGEDWGDGTGADAIQRSLESLEWNFQQARKEARRAIREARKSEAE